MVEIKDRARVAAATALLGLAAGAPGAHAGPVDPTGSSWAEHAAEHRALQAEGRRQARRWRSLTPAQRRRVQQRRRRAARYRPRVVGDPAVVGSWATSRVDLRLSTGTTVMGINAMMLPNRKVMFWSYPSEPDSGPRYDESRAFEWDPATNAIRDLKVPINTDIDAKTGQPFNKPFNIWCSGGSFLADGQVLITGGNEQYFNVYGGYTGLKSVLTYNPFTSRWTRQPNMRHGRWYPSQLLMPDGRTLIMRGLREGPEKAQNEDLEVFTPPTVEGGQGKVELVTNGTLDGSLPYAYRGAYYPHMFWMPSGRALIAGQNAEDSWLMANPGSPLTFSPTDIPNLNRRRTFGSAVLMAGGPGGSTRVLEVGGSDDTGGMYNNANIANGRTTATTELWDEARPGDGWRFQGALNIPRSHANTVLLPDGSMVAVGGGVGSDETKNRLWTAEQRHKQVELYDPATGAWRLGAAQAELRAYHSTALLLPDGRVMSAGDDRNGAAGDGTSDGTNQDTVELYSPPYLFKGARPTISSAPDRIGYGARFGVGSSTDVTKAVLVAPGAATHATDMNQRSITLSAPEVVAGKGVNLSTPSNPDVAPPGYYMLFLLNGKGVPSVARFVKLDPAAPAAAVLSPGKRTK